jgi:hypothetical protein
MTTEQKRKGLYNVLLALHGTWASLEQIEAALDYEEPKLEALLDGLVIMREVEREEGVAAPVEDDGFGGYNASAGFDDVQTFTGYRLTEFGLSWAGISCQ